ncbi:MAG: outer membrane beta-barrel protein [Gemmatimonadota bacterium]
MKRILTLLFVLLVVAAAAGTVLAAEYDRYERGYPSSPPPRAAYAPPPRHATYGQTYFFAHLGLFDPNDSWDGLAGYDSGGAFDVGIGSRVSPILAVEGTFGAYAADRGDDDVAVAPLTFGARLIVPNPIIEPYVGAGVGLYFASLDEPSTGIDDTDTTVGGYASLGIDAWLNPRVALNLEGRYHWAEPQFNGIDVDVSGWTATMGVRVSF